MYPTHSPDRPVRDPPFPAPALDLDDDAILDFLVASAAYLGIRPATPPQAAAPHPDLPTVQGHAPWRRTDGYPA